MTSIRDIIHGKTPAGRSIKRDKRALVCIDAANLNPYLGRLHIEIDWAEFKSLLESLYTKVELRYYGSELTEGYYSNRHPLATKEEIYEAKRRQEDRYNAMKQLGYIIRSKPIAQIYAGKKGLIFKCNLDVEITIDVMDRLNDFDVLVLCSGDGDFIALLKRVKHACKETHVIAADGRLNSKLKDTANHFDLLSKMLCWVQKLGKKKKP